MHMKQPKKSLMMSAKFIKAYRTQQFYIRLNSAYVKLTLVFQDSQMLTQSIIFLKAFFLLTTIDHFLVYLLNYAVRGKLHTLLISVLEIGQSSDFRIISA